MEKTVSKPVSSDYLSKEVGAEMKNDNTWEKQVTTASNAGKDIVSWAIIDNRSL